MCTHIHILMATKTIAIMEDAYHLLKSVQKPNESFSEEIRRLIKGKTTISQFAGAWKDVTEAEANQMKETIWKARETTSQSRAAKLKMELSTGPTSSSP